MRLRHYRVDTRSLIERVPFAIPAWLGLLIVVAASAAAWAVRFALDANLPPGFPFLTFFPVVIIVAFFLGARLGAVTAVVCGLLSWYSFVPPIDSFQLTANSAIAMGFYAFITTTEILLVSWMQRANRRAVAEREANAALAETRELLFRELQHRVGNNLQMVASLIALQRRNVSDVQARAALDEASRRLGTIGRISRQLYETSGDGRPLESFLRELIADVIEANGRSDVDHRIEAASDAGAMPISPDAAVPLALIVAETVANSIEHGFRDRGQAAIDISLHRPKPDWVALEVADNGHGLPDGFSLDRSNSLGLQIAATLARQLGGTYELANDPAGRGAVARLSFPLAA